VKTYERLGFKDLLARPGRLLCEDPGVRSRKVTAKPIAIANHRETLSTACSALRKIKKLFAARVRF
jgi:hypothetical protein